MNLVVGKEYEFLGQFVKLIEICGDMDGQEVLIETRFGDRTMVYADELTPKRKRDAK